VNGQGYLRMEGAPAPIIDLKNNKEGGGENGALGTTAYFRDHSAWYHIVFVWDAANATAGDRARIYINGTEVTAFNTDINPTDVASAINTALEHNIGLYAKSGGENFGGYMAEAIFLDGTANAVTDFGEFNEDSPTIWQPIDPSEQSYTYGNNGFWLDFADSADLGNDVSGQDNDWTETDIAAANQSQDSPTNNFSTMNQLNTSSNLILSNGGNTCTAYSDTVNLGSTTSTLCPNGGKWYAECKMVTVTGQSYPKIGIIPLNWENFGRVVDGDDGAGGFATGGFQVGANGTIRVDGTETSSWSSTYTDGDITAIAIDCDNGAAYFAIENTWQDSGDPTSGASKTGAAVTWTPADSDGVAFNDLEFLYSGTSVSGWNFGNGSFGDTAVTSAEADGNGYGLFEYAPPSGYLALCTKNLGSSGG